MPEFMISGIPVMFPFEPYDVQKIYMEKVIECLQNSCNAVLESPTGTGKTLSLLCSTLAWILLKKAQVQSERMTVKFEDQLFQKLSDNMENPSNEGNWGVPKIIYASRTHSQLSQAMRELKNCHYNFLKAVIVGSRDQLCIHPEVAKEPSNSVKIQLCKLKVVTRTCSFYRNVESRKDRPDFKETNILDIEDLVTAGAKHKVCPYFVSKELVQNADIIFMPYNYLLDPKARSANKIELQNTIIILDEAHNVERICEDSASIQIKSSDIASSIEDITHVMKAMTKNDDSFLDMSESPKDFTIDDLAILKEMILGLETAIDEISIPNKEDGVTFEGGIIFDIFQKANITTENSGSLSRLLDNIIQFLATASDKTSFIRKGVGLQLLADLLQVVFSDASQEYRDNVKRCYKVHLNVEEIKTKEPKKVGKWMSTSMTTKSSANKILSYWCFSPAFGMNQLQGKNVRNIILTSGTLAPLKPLITELGIPIKICLENPHIVSESQICVRIVNNGPDREGLNSSFENRNNPKYISSLGRTIVSLAQVIPHGMLVFFPSYTVLGKCRDTWQANGIWTHMTNIKSVYVEPRTKDAFINTMNEFYEKIQDPEVKGAIFMAVCRGKVSEGLDFADNNGRAVLITGLPFPPLKDPRVVLKKRYLQQNRTKQNEMLSGEEWYVLEASRAVNQAIGRVIRHKNDYGAILLCDSRFNNARQKGQLSKWIQGHLNNNPPCTNFGPLVRELSLFYRNAYRTLPQPSLRPLLETDIVPNFDSNVQKSFPMKPILPLGFDSYSNKSEIPSQSITQNELIGYYKTVETSKIIDLDAEPDVVNFNQSSSSSSYSTQKRDRSTEETSDTKNENMNNKKKIKIIPNLLGHTPMQEPVHQNLVPVDRSEFLKLVKSSLSIASYKMLLSALTLYLKEDNFNILFGTLETVFNKPELQYIFKEMHRFVKGSHKTEFLSRIK